MNTVNPDLLLDLAPRWSGDVSTVLDRAITEVAKTELVHGANFTIVAPALASVHVVAENYFQRQLQSNIENAAEFGTRLEATATAWQDAEDQNVQNHQDGG